MIIDGWSRVDKRCPIKEFFVRDCGEIVGSDGIWGITGGSLHGKIVAGISRLKDRDRLDGAKAAWALGVVVFRAAKG